MAGPITVPNASFESPVTTFVNTHVDSWQKVPKPDWYVESGGYTWDQLAGVFTNTPAGDPSHIINCDGTQAAYMFAVPEVCLFQDYDSTDWSHSTPTHAFNATFDPGTAYQLTVGVIGGGGNMMPGVTLELSLYYRDAGSNQVVVAATSITNTPAVFSNHVTLIDFQVNVPTVQVADAWAGQHIGIRLLSTVDPSLQGGYWDLDNVRLTGTRRPLWANPAWSGGQFSLTLQSEPGLQFEVLASNDPSLPIPSWTSLGTVSNATGSVSFNDAATNYARRFYRARQLP
ncbi:MAG TPA: hypothetical protein VNZ64_26805 [Candidatus Acidoferrum sp.]|nr:hypothetical protein [Candidatus Acidoferrum sp.]